MVAPIIPAGSLELPEFLVVAGSTHGVGSDFFGDANDSGDGFVTLLDKTIGNLYNPGSRARTARQQWLDSFGGSLC
jgi:hypothetical protein